MLQFPVHTGSQIRTLKAQLADKVVLCDENTASFCAPLLELKDQQIIIVPAGEIHKTLTTCEKIWTEMKQRNMDRHSEFWILGGGVLCDMGGFCASVYMRGIPFYFIPTTLLSMVDAAIGGKIGIDWHGLKNYLGLIREPEAIYCDPVFLKTLPERQWRNGWVEMLKHGLIADAAHWELLRRGFPSDSEHLLSLIQSSQEIKIKVVKEDPFEQNQRKLLNAGHTIGHAFESLALTQNWEVYHGEAVAFGLIAESKLSTALGLMSEEVFSSIREALRAFIPTLDQITGSDIDEMFNYLRSDKKKSGNLHKLSLILQPGHAQFDVEAMDVQIKTAISETIQELFYTESGR